MGRERRHCGRFISKATGGVPRRGVGGRERERGEGKRKKSYVLPLSSSASPLSQAFFVVVVCFAASRLVFVKRRIPLSGRKEFTREASERERERERERGGGGAPLRVGGKRKKGEEENILSLLFISF